MAKRESGRERHREGGRKKGKGEAGTIQATIVISKPDSLPEVETQMYMCVSPQVM